MIALRASSKNAIINERNSKTIPQKLFDSYNESIELQGNLKRGPQSNPRTMVSVQNTVLEFILILKDIDRFVIQLMLVLL